jgi:hypothetical protein
MVDALPCLSVVSDPFFKSKADVDCSICKSDDSYA